jgi:hypothetical protein
MSQWNGLFRVRLTGFDAFFANAAPLFGGRKNALF